MPVPPTYEFSSTPRAVKTRPKYRPGQGAGSDGVKSNGEPGNVHDPFFPVNIHHDPRVARGNTFAGGQRYDARTGESVPKTATRRARKLLGHGRSRGSSSSFFERRASHDFLRQEVDVSRYLIEPGEGSARPEQEADTQTDDFEERPQTPDFVPKKTGVDASTQIEVSDRLFDFEAEVQPMLAVLVGKTLEQARIEVEREYELERIREAATTLTRQRQEEAQQVSELKQAAVEAEREKEELRRRRRQEASRRRAAREKVACLQLVRQVLPLSLDRAFEELSAKSWVTPSVEQVKTVFLPWLFEQIAVDVDQRSAVCDGVLDGLLESVENMAEAATSERIDSRQRGAQARQEAKRVARERIVRLFVPAELVGGEEGERLGPITVRAGETVETVEVRVAEWLASEGGVEELPTPDGGFLAGYLREARRRGRGRHRLGKDSALLDVQEHLGAPSNEVVLQAVFEVS
ncbi:unnamed protein product [Hapterophycus canaliculatus]